jgi:preprotein translocase subunit SecG
MLYAFFMIIFIVCCIVLATLILMQSGKGQGLAGLVGNDNVQSMLGAHAADVIEKITWGVVVVFFVLVILLSLITANRRGSIVDKVQLDEPVQQATQSAPSGQSVPEQTVPSESVPAGVDNSIPKDAIKETVPATKEIPVDTTKPAVPPVTE